MSRPRSKIYGVGVNDGPVGNSTCPFYARWKDVIRRCYSDRFKEKYPTYADCTMCDEWLLLSNFTEWMKLQDWEGNDLDKDLTIPGNKHYSPETCLFVPHSINALLLDSGAKRGKHPQGVYFDKSTGRFKAKCWDNSGKNVHIGRFDTESEARKAYVKFKVKVIVDAANDHPRLSGVLMRHAEILKNSVT